MNSRIKKSSAIKKLKEHKIQIYELKTLNHQNEKFIPWLDSLNNLIEDLFSKDSRQFTDFKKIKFHPGILFLGSPSNEKYQQDSYNESLIESYNYLINLIKFIEENWIDYDNQSSDIIDIKPNFMGLGINFNAIIKKFFKRKKRK